METTLVKYRNTNPFTVSDCGIIWNGKGIRLPRVKTEDDRDVVLDNYTGVFLAFYVDSILDAAWNNGYVEKAFIKGGYVVHKGRLIKREHGSGISFLKDSEREDFDIDLFLHNPTVQTGGLTSTSAKGVK